MIAEDLRSLDLQHRALPPRDFVTHLTLPTSTPNSCSQSVMTAMEASVSSTDNTIYQHLFLAKERFRQQNQHRRWSEEQLDLEWTRLLSTTGAGLGSATTGASYTPEMIPRTMPSWTGWSLDSADAVRALPPPRQRGLWTNLAP
jgi:hypothetical protein